jgi:cytochrome P450
MEGYLAQLISDRRTADRRDAAPDLLDEMIAAHDAGGMSHDELVSMLITLFVAGYDTSKNVLTMIMHEMLTRPEVYARCAEDPAYCHQVVEESLRFQSPGTSSRLTNEDIVYRDVLLPKDTMLFLPNSTSGRDATAVPDPDRFDPERPQAGRHLAFGRGMHLCLGQYIARAQIEEGLHLIAQRIRDPQLAGEFGYRRFPGVWGFKGMPISFTPAPARAGAPAVN